MLLIMPPLCCWTAASFGWSFFIFAAAESKGQSDLLSLPKRFFVLLLLLELRKTCGSQGRSCDTHTHQFLF